MSEHVTEISRHLAKLQSLQSLAEKACLADNIRDLQAWQCKRLIASHQDMWRNPRFRPAMQFFVDELYGPKDFSQRDADIARMVPKMAKFLPDKALASLNTALHLNTLSFELDFDLARQLGGEDVNRESYALAYAGCENHDARIQQLQFIRELGLALSDVVGIRGISTLLTLARRPAKLAGVLSLHEFLEAGYTAFRKLGRVEDFIDPIVTQEIALCEALFNAQRSNPLPEVA